MNEEPKLSVVLCSIGSSCLREIVDSFLESPCLHELLLVIDKPDLVIEDFLSSESRQRQKLKIIINDENIGLTRSLNKAINRAKGNVIVRADDDDLPDTKRLEEIYQFFKNNPKTDIVYSFAEGLDVTTGKKWNIQGPKDDEEIKAALRKRNFIVHASLAFRKDSLANIGFYDERFYYAQDYDLYLRSIVNGKKFGCIPKILVTRQYHAQSITVARRKRQILYSMIARLFHVAACERQREAVFVALRYITLLLIPNWARAFRRKTGHGR